MAQIKGPQARHSAGSVWSKTISKPKLCKECSAVLCLPSNQQPRTLESDITSSALLQNWAHIEEFKAICSSIIFVIWDMRVVKYQFQNFHIAQSEETKEVSKQAVKAHTTSAPELPSESNGYYLGSEHLELPDKRT